MTSKNFVLSASYYLVVSVLGFFLSTVEYLIYLRNKKGAHCQMPACFSYLQFSLH